MGGNRCDLIAWNGNGAQSGAMMNEDNCIIALNAIAEKCQHGGEAFFEDVSNFVWTLDPNDGACGPLLGSSD